MLGTRVLAEEEPIPPPPSLSFIPEARSDFWRLSSTPYIMLLGEAN